MDASGIKKKNEEEDKFRGSPHKSSVADGRKNKNKNKTTKLVINFSGATLEAEIDIQGHQLPTSLSGEEYREIRNNSL